MGLRNTIKDFNNSENFWVGLLRDLLSVIFVAAILSSVSYIALGRWSPMVAVESESMVPNMQIGDIIFVQGIDRTDVITREKGKEIEYVSFGDHGDVVLYKRSGNENLTPIIHRVMYYVNKGEPMWKGGPPAPYEGYITKGDNNNGFDQQGSVSYLEPIKKEWIMGVTRFTRIPVLGYFKLILMKALAFFSWQPTY